MNLTTEQLEHFNYRGWLLVDTLSAAKTSEVQSWVTDIASWSDNDGEWLHVLYTDVWMSMGDPEADRIEKEKDLASYSISDELMSLASKDAIFMHCLPAHRGQEVSASVMDGPASKIWRQAYHRRTTIQAILYHSLRGELKGRI